jgi:hypothetical protein
MPRGRWSDRPHLLKLCFISALAQLHRARVSTDGVMVNAANRHWFGDDVIYLLVKDDLHGRVLASVRLLGTERPA